MNVKKSIFDYLQSKTLLTDLIAARLYPDVAKQQIEKPYVVYEIPSSEHDEDLLKAGSLARYSVVFSIYAVASDSRNDVREAIRNILNGRRSVIQDSVDFRSFRLRSTTETNPSLSDGKQLGDFVCEMTFAVTIFETLPTLP